MVRGMPLGLMPGMDYEEVEGALQPTESLTLTSDGLAEAHAPDGEMFGTDRLREAIAAADGSGDLVAETLAAHEEFVGNDWEQEDDITMVTLTRVPRTCGGGTMTPLGSRDGGWLLAAGGLAYFLFQWSPTTLAPGWFEDNPLSGFWPAALGLHALALVLTIGGMWLIGLELASTRRVDSRLVVGRGFDSARPHRQPSLVLGRDGADRLVRIPRPSTPPRAPPPRRGRPALALLCSSPAPISVTRTADRRSGWNGGPH